MHCAPVPVPPVHISTVEIDGSQKTPLPHFWSACVGSSHGAMWLRADWLEHLRMAKELGVTSFGMWYEYIQRGPRLSGAPFRRIFCGTGRRTLSTTANREIFSAGLLGCVFQRLQR